METQLKYKMKNMIIKKLKIILMDQQNFKFFQMKLHLKDIKINLENFKQKIKQNNLIY